MGDAAGRRVRGPSPRKRAAILDAAREIFLDRGFAGTSMDDVATRAGVSKQTVYAHFSDKPTLFTELIAVDVGQTEQQEHPLTGTMADSDDLDRDLRAYARWHLSVVMQPHLVRMRRMLIGEAERFPELARSWYVHGPEQSCRLFAGWFAALDRRGVLRVDDPEMAGQHFNWLVLSIPLNRAMADASAPSRYTAEDLDACADAGVRVFLAAYRSDRRAPRAGPG